MNVLLFLSVFICLCTSCLSVSSKLSPVPTEIFPFSKILDVNGNYILYWKFNSTHITFETHVRTKGYVGFGLSSNGKMFPADVVIGWVKDGVTHFKDRHAEGHFKPVVDTSQDWVLLHGEENHFGTILKMVRKLDTCDPEDMKITNDTIRIIYSYHSHDPTTDDSIPYHGSTHRGSKSVMLLTMLKPPVLPSDVKTKDILNDNYHVPQKDTVYSCRVFSVADITTKHHIVKFSPVVQKGHESLVHHILLYKCPAISAQYIGHQYLCYGRERNIRTCETVFLGWATGGEDFNFPHDVGMPIGDDTDFLIMETHYNNPGLRNDYIDSSGLRIYYTPTLRSHDAGILVTGVLENKWQIIPPNVPDFRSTGFCTDSCLNKGLKDHPTGVNIFAVLQHAHLLGRGIRTRQYRQGVELEPLAFDENYDFDFQDYRYLRNYRTLQSGDTLVVECKYDSTSRKNITTGGPATTDEMCLSFIFYYPAMDVTICESVPLYRGIPGLGHTHPYHGKDTVTPYVHSLDWSNNTVVDYFKTLINETDHLALCLGKYKNNVTMEEVKLPQPNIEYSETSNCLSNPISGTPSPIKTSIYTLRPDAVPKPTQNFEFKEQLDKNGSYFLFWDVNSTHITFEVHVRTHGYVGFGLSPNGNMYPADVVIGWVKNGKPYFKDRHTVAFSEPLIDISQDWLLLHAEENDFGTVLKMIRKLDTCDGHDFKITDSTIKVIYSYHPDDPAHETGLPYHGNTRRGARSMMLLSKTKDMALPADVVEKDLLNDNFHVPGVSTYYNCRVFDFSDMGGKHHLVRFEPFVQKGNEGIVHHIVVYKCPGINRKYIGTTYNCNHVPDRSLHLCGIIYLAWAVGGEVYNFPENVGLPFGEPNDPNLYIMETHYNNPSQHTGYLDSSGLRLSLTPTLRTHDAGVLTVGAKVNQYQVIPPYEPAFISSGFCTENCLKKGLDPQPNGVTVFAILQHAHLLAVGIKTRVIRKGVEQMPLADDTHYDFDFQDMRVINRTLKSGDTIVVECTYDSSKKTQPTFGGLATTDEMCLSFIYYYPRMATEVCQTEPLYDDIPIPHNHIIQESKVYNWTDPDHRRDFKQYMANTHYRANCVGNKLQPQYSEEKVYIPTSRYPYIPPKSPCDGY